MEKRKKLIAIIIAIIIATMSLYFLIFCIYTYSIMNKLLSIHANIVLYGENEEMSQDISYYISILKNLKNCFLGKTVFYISKFYILKILSFGLSCLTLKKSIDFLRH